MYLNNYSCPKHLNKKMCNTMENTVKKVKTEILKRVITRVGKISKFGG